MSKPRIALVIFADSLLVVVLVLILQIDKLVNGTLYNYGLTFSNNWAQPYWLMLRASLILIVVVIFLITLVEFPQPSFEKGKSAIDSAE